MLKRIARSSLPPVETSARLLPKGPDCSVPAPSVFYLDEAASSGTDDMLGYGCNQVPSVTEYKKRVSRASARHGSVTTIVRVAP